MNVTNATNATNAASNNVNATPSLDQAQGPDSPETSSAAAAPGADASTANREAASADDYYADFVTTRSPAVNDNTYNVDASGANTSASRANLLTSLDTSQPAASNAAGTRGTPERSMAAANVEGSSPSTPGSDRVAVRGPDSEAPARNSASRLSPAVKSNLDAAGLTPGQRAKAETLLTQFASTPSYARAKKDEGALAIPFQESLRGSQSFFDKYYTGAVVSAVKSPGNAPLNNSVQAISRGWIDMRAIDQPMQVKYFGQADGTKYVGMNINQGNGIQSLPKGADQKQFNTTLSHEVNHYLNDLRAANPKDGNADRFWNEYRSKIVGYVGGGVVPTNTTKQDVLHTLTDQVKDHPYAKLGQLYQADPKVKKIVDDALKGNPKDTFSARDMQQSLLKAGYLSQYILLTTNTDNNLNDLMKARGVSK
jgi:hypothetical protein